MRSHIALLEGRQREIILQAAEFNMLPSEGVLRRIAELENAIVAVEAVAGKQADKARRSKG